MVFPQNVTQALHASRDNLKAKEEAVETAESRGKLQEKALTDNLDAMRAERDNLAELTAKLERKRERPAGVDASGESCRLSPLIPLWQDFRILYKHR